MEEDQNKLCHSKITDKCLSICAICLVAEPKTSGIQKG
jgi:hypothetical protein